MEIQEHTLHISASPATKQYQWLQIEGITILIINWTWNQLYYGLTAVLVPTSSLKQWLSENKGSSRLQGFLFKWFPRVSSGSRRIWLLVKYHLVRFWTATVAQQIRGSYDGNFVSFFQHCVHSTSANERPSYFIAHNSTYTGSISDKSFAGGIEELNSQ